MPAQSEPAPVIASIWAPLQRPIFRNMLGGYVVAALGIWMQDIASSWLMTSLSPTPAMVSLTQTATYLPFFLLSLPAGALADIFDRRLILLITQFWMFLAVIGLGWLTLINAITPWLLILLIFIINLGGAMQAPACNSLIPKLVPTSQLEPAIALQSAGFNCARGIGAALGGFLVRACGPGWVFLLDAVTMIFFGGAIFSWQSEKSESQLPTETVIGAMKAGMRYVRHSRAVRAVLMRTGTFVICASALWGLLPLLARTVIGLDSGQYGLTLTAFGAGNLIGATILPKFRRKISLDVLMSTGIAIFASAMAIMANCHNFPVAATTMLCAGAGWMFACNAIYSALLMASPDWVRARAVAIYLIVFQGCLAFGSLIWGLFANHFTMPRTITAAAALLLVSLLMNFRYRLVVAEQLDMRKSGPWPKVEVGVTPHPNQGPVLITIEYLIAPETSGDFIEAMGQVEKQRRRNGSFQWHLFVNLSGPGIYTESFFVETWSEYLRQRDRATVDDISAEQKALEFHISDEEPKITRFVSERRRAKPQ